MSIFILQTGAAYPFSSLAMPTRSVPALGDIDGDGDLDLVVGEIDGQLRFFKNTGSATAHAFVAQTGCANPFNGFDVADHSAPALADLDGDGDLDLLVGQISGALSYFQNTPRGNTPVYALQTGASNPFNGVVLGANTGPSVGDVDGDGDLDVVVGDANGKLRYFQNTGSATNPDFVEQTDAANPFGGVNVGNASAPSLGDVDVDGDLDLVIGSSAGALKLYLNTGTDKAPVYVEQTGTADPFLGFFTGIDAGLNSKPVLGDIDGDGDLDVLVGNQQGPLNSPPVAVNDTFITTEDDLVFENLLAANPRIPDIDPDGDVLTVTEVNGVAANVGSPIPLGLGVLTVLADGRFSFDPGREYDMLRPGDTASLSFTYTIADGQSGSASAAVTIRIEGVNDAPEVSDDSAVTAPNTPVTIHVLSNDTDVDGGALATVSAVTQGSNGSVVVGADDRSVRYTPKAGFTGFDNFTYTASDGSGGEAVGKVQVLVPSYIGSAGNDVPLGTQQADFVTAGDGNDRVLTYAGADYVDGGRGADTISGGLGADTLLGGDGADTFLTTAAELAGDSIDGGIGIDTLRITDPIAVMPAAFTLLNVELLSFPGSLQVGHTGLLDLSALTLSGTGNQINGGTANTRISGTRSNDRITDSAGNDDLRGADGNDTIMAGVGQDTVYGGSGNDTLGGSSSMLGDGSVDTFVFNTALTAATNVDTIIGFEASSRDVIALDSGIFPAIGLALDAGEFLSAIGGNAADGDDFILFDPATGALYYDADGHGAGARIQFATLGAGLTGTVDAADFAVGSYPG